MTERRSGPLLYSLDYTLEASAREEYTRKSRALWKFSSALGLDFNPVAWVCSLVIGVLELPHVYCINLDRSTDRWQWMERQFKTLSMPFTRIPAVNGQSLSDEEAASLVNAQHPHFRPRLMTKNAIGCALSHLRAYQAFLESGHDLCLVCEDDVTFKPETGSVVRSIEQNWTEGDFVTLFFCGEEKVFTTIGEKRLSQQHTLNFAVDPGKPYSAVAYLIDRPVAQGILELNKRVTYSADSWGHFWSEGAVASVKAVLPPVTEPAHFASDIGYSLAGRVGRALERLAGRPLFGELRSLLGRKILMRYRLVEQPVRARKGK